MHCARHAHLQPTGASSPAELCQTTLAQNHSAIPHRSHLQWDPHAQQTPDARSQEHKKNQVGRLALAGIEHVHARCKYFQKLCFAGIRWRSPEFHSVQRGMFPCPQRSPPQPANRARARSMPSKPLSHPNASHRESGHGQHARSRDNPLARWRQG